MYVHTLASNTPRKTRQGKLIAQPLVLPKSYEEIQAGTLPEPSIGYLVHTGVSTCPKIAVVYPLMKYKRKKL
jgi:hypothetical protein